MPLINAHDDHAVQAMPVRSIDISIHPILRTRGSKHHQVSTRRAQPSPDTGEDINEQRIAPPCTNASATASAVAITTTIGVNAHATIRIPHHADSASHSPSHALNIRDFTALRGLAHARHRTPTPFRTDTAPESPAP